MAARAQQIQKRGGQKNFYGDCQHTDLRDCICVRRGLLTTRQPHLTRALNPRIEERKRPLKARNTERAEAGKAKAEAGEMSRQKPKTSREGRHAKKGGLTRKRGKRNEEREKQET